MEIATGIVEITGSIITTISAVVILRELTRLKSFSFLKTEVYLLIISQAAQFFYGLQRVLYLDFIKYGWYGPILVGILEMGSILSLQLFFWNLAFTYWLSSRQLKVWVTVL